MITHIVAWKFKPALTEEQKAEGAKRIRPGLERLVGEIDGLISAKVYPLNPRTSTHELILVSTFEDGEALDAYQSHPSHLAMKETVHAYCCDRVCLDHSGGSFYASSPKKKQS